MIPVASILSIVGPLFKGIAGFLNSAAGNMLKGWFKGRKDQQRIDKIAQHKREGKEVSRVSERIRKIEQKDLERRFGGAPDDPNARIRVRDGGPGWGSNR